MQSFKQFILESFENPVPIHWSKSKNVDQWIGRFTVSSYDYVLDIIQYDPESDRWTIEFYMVGEYGQKIYAQISKYDKEIKIDFMTLFATVMKGIKEFIEEVNPDKFTFAADISEPKRIPIYTRFANYLDKTYDYEHNEKDSQNPETGVIYKVYKFIKKIDTKYSKNDNTKVVIRKG